MYDELVKQQVALVAALQSNAMKFSKDPNLSRDANQSLSLAVDKLATLCGLARE
jgi:hypothetical protein